MVSKVWCEVLGGFCDGEIFEIFEGVKYYSICKIVWVMETGLDGLVTEVEKIQRWDFSFTGRVRECERLGEVQYFQMMGWEVLDFDTSEDVKDEISGDECGGDCAV